MGRRGACPVGCENLRAQALAARRAGSAYPRRMQTNQERGCQVSPPNKDRKAGQREGERRKDAAHYLLESRREIYIRRARRALLLRLLEAGTATADDVAERIGLSPDGIDPRFLGTVPGPLARARLIRRAGFVSSTRPSRNAS